MDTYNNWSDEQKKRFKLNAVIIGIAIVLFLIIVIASASGGNQVTNETAADTPTATEQNDEPKTKLELVREIAGVPDAYMFDPYSSEPTEVDENSVGPYEIVVNSNEAVQCNYAKGQTFEAMKGLFTNDEIKDGIYRVVYTANGYLVTSLSGNDGRDMTNGDGWKNGSTNFFRTYFDNGFEVDSREDAVGKDTWILSLNDCR